MPEFEEPEATSSSKEEYTPSIDATNKPRTRRRSGGFKTGFTTPNASMGEVDPVDALKKEKLSGGSKPAPKPKKQAAAPKADKPEPKPKREKPSPRVSNAQPSPETLAAIGRVEARLDERKKERDAKRAERDKNRPPRGDKKPSGKKPGSNRKPQSQGIIASILSFFGLGPKQPTKQPSSPNKSSENKGQGNRPRSKGKGGNRPQGQNRRGGKGRRSGGNGPRRNDRRSQEKSSS